MPQKTKTISKIILISFLLSPTANAWVEAPDDGSNILAPLNASSVEQTKVGRLGVQGGLTLSITTAQRDALPTPAEGLLIYNTDTKQLEIYSVGAWKAVGTSSGDTTPLGTIAYFDLDACPQGWTEVTDARGRYLVGEPAGGERGVSSVTGQALTSKENRSVGQHTHPATQEPHSHTYDKGVSQRLIWDGSGSPVKYIWGTETPTSTVTPKITVDNAGSVSGTNAPYIQFLVCKKTSASSSGSSSGGSSGTDVFWKKTGNDVYYNDGNVGVGTSTPTQKMEVTGNLKATGVCIGNDCRSAWPQAEQSWWAYNSYSSGNLGVFYSYDLMQTRPGGISTPINLICECSRVFNGTTSFVANRFNFSYSCPMMYVGVLTYYSFSSSCAEACYFTLRGPGPDYSCYAD